MSGILSSNPSVFRRLGAIAGCVFVLLSTSARADDTHYRAIPIGAHAIGLGGAFTGVADDVSSAYFNPAGLALGGTVGIAGGLTINAWERFELERALNGGEEEGAGATDTNARTVPIFIGVVLKFGERDKDDERKNSLAVSVVEPIFSRTGFLLTLEGDPIELSESYRVEENDRATWYGISYSRRLSRKQSIGASLYLSTRRLNHLETGLNLDGGQAVAPEQAIFEGVSSSALTEDLAFKTFHFVLRLGWLSRLKPQLQLGVMVQPPGIPLKQRVNVFSQGFVNVAQDPTSPTVTAATFLDTKADADLPLPAEIEVGLQYWPVEKVMLAMDVSFHAPVRSRDRIKLDGPASNVGLFFDRNTKRRATGNVAIGADFFISRKISMATGFFTDLSSAAKIPANPTRFYNPRTNRFGATLSLGVNAGGVSLAVGSTFIYGRGDATGTRLNLNDLTIDYTRTGATSRIVYLHVTGATRAVTELGTKAQEGIQKKMLERKNGAPE